MSFGSSAGLRTGPPHVIQDQEQRHQNGPKSGKTSQIWGQKIQKVRGKNEVELITLVLVNTDQRIVQSPQGFTVEWTLTTPSDSSFKLITPGR